MIDPVTNRQIPFNLEREPSYEGLFTVTFYLKWPDYVSHLKHKDCRKERPHLIKNCGMFIGDDDEIKKLNCCVSYPEL